MVVRGGAEHGIFHGVSDESVSMEEASMATTSEGGCGAHDEGCSMEAQPSMASPAILGKEVAAVYGHYGTMRQKMNNPDTWHLM